MRFGLVSDLAQVPDVCAAGFDYLELRLTEVANPLSVDDEAFERNAEFLRQQPLPVDCMCMLFPAGVKVVGPQRDEEQVRAYLDKVLLRANKLGCQLIVWGSGGSRFVPDGFPRAEAWEQFKRTAAYAADLGKRLGMGIALEPLNRGETNFLNLAGECLDLADELKRDNIGVIADVDHWSREEPDVQAAIRRAGSRIMHVHLRDSNGGMPGTGGYDFARFARTLRELGYATRVSYETRGVFAAGLAHARAYVEQLFPA